jgi:ATP-dependent DNA ligase
MKDTDGNEWACQLKIDGYRALLHAEWTGNGHSITIFSRSMNDITESLPELSVELGLPAGDFILDGEVIAETGSYSDTSERVGRKEENVDRSVEMQFAVFDAIIYAGESVWKQPYRSRYSRLQSLDMNTSDTVQLLPLHSDYDSAKKQALDNGEEGLILKRMDAAYEFGKRSSSWVKHKFDAENCDLKIAGFEEGTGKASGTLGYVELETSDGVYVGNSGSGFTDEQRDEIWNNQDEWLGRTIEIEARGVGTGDKLRMPIFKRDRSDDGTPDSWERVKELMKEV